MTWAELRRDRRIVPRPLILVLNQQADRCAGGHALEYTGQDPNLVGFLPLGGEFRLARPALVEPGLDVCLGQLQQRRAAIDHAANRRAMALAPCRDPEQMTETVVGHGGGPSAFRDGDVGRLRVLHPHDVIAAVDMMHLARHAG